MARYFTARRASAFWVGDDTYSEPMIPALSVSDHEPTNTGLIDINGDPIMRAPNPIGFGKDDEW